MATDIYLSLGLSIVAIAVSVISFVFTYRRSRKREQIKLCMDISNRLDEAKDKIVEFKGKLKSKNTTDQDIIAGWKTDLRDADILYLSHWEFFAFLVHTKEIEEKKLLDYYKIKFKTEVKDSHDRYLTERDNEERFPEIKKLLEEWVPDYSSHFESKKK